MTLAKILLYLVGTVPTYKHVFANCHSLFLMLLSVHALEIEVDKCPNTWGADRTNWYITHKMGKNPL